MEVVLATKQVVGRFVGCESLVVGDRLVFGQSQGLLGLITPYSPVNLESEIDPVIASFLQLYDITAIHFLLVLDLPSRTVVLRYAY